MLTIDFAYRLRCLTAHIGVGLSWLALTRASLGGAI